MKKVKVALYGSNGHQLQGHLENCPVAELVGYAEFAEDRCPDYFASPEIKKYASLDELLADDEVELVSLCSPLRSEQAGHAVKCLEAGKCVLGEKPSAMTEPDLDAIIETAARTGKTYHEMAATAFEPPYNSIREVVLSGKIGKVIQVISQKSYPWTENRTVDENIDGGLALQVGVYNARFVEHLTGIKIAQITSLETQLGNDLVGGECRRAVSFLMKLENGGVASAVANYCGPCQPTWGKWGYENVRIFGELGFVESINHGEILRLVINGESVTDLEGTAVSPDYLGMVFQEISENRQIIPLSIEDELHPTRMVIRARKR